MSEKLTRAQITNSLYVELQYIGFGKCPTCMEDGEPDEDCETCHGAGDDRPVSGTDLVDLMGYYFELLTKTE